MGVKFKTSKKLNDLLKGKIIDEFKSRENLEKIGKLAAKLVYGRTKEGKGVTDAKSPSPGSTSLKELKPSYIEFRKRYPPTGRFSSVEKSNLTYTGTLLDSITPKIKKASIKLTLEGPHHAGMSNKKLGEIVQEQRPFFALTGKEQKNITSEMKKLMRLLVRRYST